MKAMADTGIEIPSWVVTIGTAALGAAAGFVVALINRGPALEAAINHRVETLVKAQDAHIQTLMREVHSLRDKVEALTRALQVKDETCRACEHWQDVVSHDLERLGGSCSRIPPEEI